MVQPCLVYLVPAYTFGRIIENLRLQGFTHLKSKSLLIRCANPLNSYIQTICRPDDKLKEQKFEAT